MSASGSRIMQGDLVLLSLGRGKQVITFEHITQAHCKLFSASPFFAIFKGLRPDFIRREKGLFLNSFRHRFFRKLLFSFQQIQQHRNHMLATITGVRTITRHGNSAVYIDLGGIVTVTAIHLVNIFTQLFIIIHTMKRPVSIEVFSTLENYFRISNVTDSLRG